MLVEPTTARPASVMERSQPTTLHRMPTRSEGGFRTPYVVLSCAMSLDGYLDDTTGRRLILSNDEDWDRVDSLRSWADAILVGAGTVRADNPRLQVRSGRRRADRLRALRAATPLRVVVSSTGRLDATLALFDPAVGGTLVYTEAGAAAETRERLGTGTSVIGMPAPLDLRAVLHDLAMRGVERLVVEGGGTILTQFLSQGLADELQLVTAPFFVGDASAPRFVGPGRFPNDSDRPLRLAETRALGDLVYARYLTTALPEVESHQGP